MSELAAWCTSSIRIERFGILPIKFLNSFAFLSSSSSKSDFCPLVSTLFKITFSAFTTNTCPKGLGKHWFTF